MTLRNFFETIYFPRRLAGRAKRTAGDYRGCINQLEAFLHLQLTKEGKPKREILLSDLSDALLAGAMAWLVGKERANGTANKLFRSIRAIWNLAVEDKLLFEKTRCTPYPEIKRIPVCWSQEEMGAILEAAACEPGYMLDIPMADIATALGWMIYNIGSRIDAIMRTPSDAEHLNLEEGWVLISGDVQKQKADQRFDLLPQTIEALRRIHPERFPTIFGVWIFDRTTRGWRALIKLWRRVLKRAGLPSGKRDLFHKVRRTCLTFVAAAAGKPAAQTVGGHSDPSVTDRYLDPRFLKLPSLRTILPAPEVATGPRLWRPEAG